MSNPSMHTHTPGPWSTRPSIQDRLTIFSEKDLRPICTIIHPDCVSDENLRLIKASPDLVAALTALRREAAFAHRHLNPENDLEKEIHTRLQDALHEAERALACVDMSLL